MVKSDEIVEKIEKARIMAQLETHQGWIHIKELLNGQIENDRKSLEHFGLDLDATNRLRARIEIMRWVLKSTQLASEDQIKRWEERLAFQQKMETLRESHGLPRDLKEYPHEEEQGQL